MLEQLMLTVFDCEVVCFGETWLQPDTTVDTHLTINGYLHFRRDRQTGTHGGLLVYVKSHLCTQRRTDLESPEIECLVLEISLRTQGKILLFFCYRPPDFPPDRFFSTLSSCIAKNSNQSLLILLGDFNAKSPLWDGKSSPKAAGTFAAACSMIFL